MIGTSDQSCWLAEACKILLLILLGTLTDYAEYLIHSCVTAASLPCKPVKQHSVLHSFGPQFRWPADREKARLEP